MTKSLVAAIVVASFSFGSVAAAHPVGNSITCGPDKKEKPDGDGSEAAVPSCGPAKKEKPKDER
jgi:hypothetical protein